MKYVIIFAAGIATGVAGLLGGVWISEGLNRRKW